MKKYICLRRHIFKITYVNTTLFILFQIFFEKKKVNRFKNHSIINSNVAFQNIQFIRFSILTVSCKALRFFFKTVDNRGATRVPENFFVLFDRILSRADKSAASKKSGVWRVLSQVSTLEASLGYKVSRPLFLVELSRRVFSITLVGITQPRHSLRSD